jgi:adenylate cyclase
MSPLSESVSLAWRLAAEEALRSGDSHVELSHLLVGICRIEGVLREEIWERYAIVPGSWASIGLEWNDVHSAMINANLDPIGFRREVRSLVPQSFPISSSDRVVKRSESTRAVFELAQQRAGKENRGLTTLSDLLASLVSQILKENSDLACRFTPTFRKLDDLLTTSFLRDVHISLDAARSADSAPRKTKSKNEEFLFYDFPLQLASRPNLQALLDFVVSSLLEIFPSANRAALLLREQSSDRMLLQAHLPPGEPCASMQLSEYVLETNAALIWSPTASIPGDVGNRSLTEISCSGAMYAPLYWQNERLGVLCVDTRHTDLGFSIDDLRLFIGIAHHVAFSIHSNHLTQDLRAQNLLLKRLLTHFSPKVRELIVERATRGRLKLGGERSQVSILFSDIRGFTRLSAGMEPDDVVDMLNVYFEALVDAIFQNGGTVDKYIGDAILAVFGTPEIDPKHHDHALRAALGMQEAMRSLNGTRASRNLPVSEIGIGIHCGDVVHGFVGTQDRMEFTVVGDAVNRASRFCSAARANEIVLSQEFHRHVWREVEVEPHEVSTKHEGNWPAFRVLRAKNSR